jgi:hypothetical protein
MRERYFLLDVVIEGFIILKLIFMDRGCDEAGCINESEQFQHTPPKKTNV